MIKQCYCIVWSVEKKTESENLRVAKTNKGKLMLLPKLVVYDSKMQDLLRS